MAPRGLPHGAPLLRGLALQPLCSPPCVASGAALRQPGNTPARRPSLPPRPRPAQAQAWGTDSSTWWAKLHVFELLCHFVRSHVAASPLSLSPGGSVALRLCRADCCQLARWPFFLLRALSASFSSPGADFQK